MKRTIIFCMLLAFSLAAMARPVSQADARRVAQTWMQAQGMKNPAALQDITSQTPFTEFYVFAAPEGGFVLVSGDDCVKPVLAYSVKNIFMPEGMPMNVRSFLEGYEAEIRWWKNHSSNDISLSPLQVTGSAAPTTLPAAWRELLDGAVPPPVVSTAVAPLLTTTWNQSPLYNNLCPDDNSGYGPAVTGCVATATAQVMKYYNYPTTGYGSHTYSSAYQGQNATYVYNNLTANFGATTYQWSQMPNELTSSSSTAQINAVATLMYHIGVADEMTYSPEESGAQNYNSTGAIRASSQTSLMKYFKYRPDMVLLRRGDESDAAFATRLRAELDQSRPILYSGSDVVGGHSFVLDGYNQSGYFHVNWGWGGYQDDYYTIGSLNPGEGGTGGNATYTFNLRNAALTCIRPNTSWSTSGTTSVSVTSQNAPSGCSAAAYNKTSGNQSSSYSFGDTVMLYATATAGYRFNGWADGDKTNPRYFIANGGSYSFTATFAQVGTDTVSYCPTDAPFSAYSLNGNEWGVKFPASTLDASKSMTAVMFYAYRAGSYDISVYTGASHSTLAAITTYNVASGDEGAWQTVPLGTSVPATEDVWIIFDADNVDYPAAFTSYSGVPSSFMFGFDEYGSYYRYSFMIKGVFSSEVSSSGDTVSYCGNSTPNVGGVGNSNGGTWQWGIMLPPSTLNNNYLKSVMLYVLDGFNGSYTLSLYRGGTDSPSTLVHTQEVNFTSSGWQEALISTPFALDNQNLWITFTTTATYPMSTCAYTGAANSDWLNNGGTWVHLADYNLNYSWLIKAVTSATASGNYPPPTIAIDGQQQLGKGMAYTFTTTATSGATVSWSLAGASPSTATGISATATWNTPGTYYIIATATSSYGSGRDTLVVNVVDYTQGDTVSYVLDREHYTNVGTGSASAFGWGIMMPSAFLTGRTQLTGVKAGLYEIGNYTLTVYQGGTDAPQTQIGSYSFSLTAADTAGRYYTYMLPSPLAISSASNLWVVISSTDMSYPAGATAHTTDPNSDWTLFNGNWRHLSQLGINGSWEIKLVMGQSSAPQTQYTITANSSNSAWGTVSGGGTYNSGATATLTATANTGYRFAHWQDGNTQNPRTITVTGNATYTATFEAIPYYTITVTSGNPAWGTVSGGGTYAAGSTVTISATPNTGYRFGVWQDGNTQNPRTITVTGNATYTATFEAIPPTQYTITANSNNSAWGTVTGGGTYNSGATATLTATPASGYHFVQWQDGNTQNPRTITVTGNATYTATFAANASQDDPCVITSFPWSEDFDGDLSTLNCWDIYDYNNNDTTWGFTTTYGYNGSNCAYVIYQAQAMDGLASPMIVTPGNYTVSWKARIMSSYYPETYQVWILRSNNPGMIFNETLTDTIYQDRSASFTVEAGDTVRILWNYLSEDMYALFLDNFAITQGGSQPTQYTITANSNNSAWGTVTGGGTYNSGATVTLTATPASGYHFVQWQDNNTQNPRTITVTGNATYTATFAQDEAPQPGGLNDDCVITGYPYTQDFNTSWPCWSIYDMDSDVDTAQHINRWYYFNGVGTNGSVAPAIYNSNSNTSGDYLMAPLMTTPGTYTATWQARAYVDDVTLYYYVGAYDWVNGGLMEGYIIDSVISSTWATKSFNFTVGVGDTVRLAFIYVSSGGHYFIIDDVTISEYNNPQPTQYTITANSNNTAWGTVTGGGTYNSGATATLTATPASGYRFVQWQDNNTQNPRTITVTGNATYTATFAEDVSCPAITQFPYSESFDEGIGCWTAIDGNNDNSTWQALNSISGSTSTITPHSGSAMMGSFSWNNTAMQANEYLVSPQIVLPAGQSITLSWWFMVNGEYPEDKLAVRLSTTGTAVSNFSTTLVDITPTSANGSWTQQTIDLSAYAGQSIYLAFHHHDSYDMNYILLDDIQITTAAQPTQYTITANSNNSAWGTVSGGGTYNSGATATLTATPTSGYRFVSWQDGNTQNPRTITVTGNATYTATFEAIPPTQYTITVYSNNTAWGTVTGGGTYNSGATATLTATPTNGYRFVSWQDGNTQNPRTITVTGNATYTATFEAIQYTITANSNNTAWGTVTGGGTYNSGATATLTATPTNGYRFVSWQDGNTQNPRSITVTGNATYTATFEAIPPTQYTITVLSNNDAWGTVSGGGTYNEGATATLTATPTNGYQFVGWNDGNTDNPRTVTVTGPATYIATFEAMPVQYTITVLSNNDTWGTVSGGGTYNEGATATLTATPANGYHFVSWNDGNTDNPRTITVTASTTYIATFEVAVGIDGVETAAVAIVPNPATEYATLQGLKAGIEVTLVDINGKIRYSGTAQSDMMTLDVSDLAAGVYFVRVSDGTETAVRKLIVK